MKNEYKSNWNEIDGNVRWFLEDVCKKVGGSLDRGNFKNMFIQVYEIRD